MPHVPTDAELEKAVQDLKSLGGDEDQYALDVGISRPTFRRWIQGGSDLPQKPNSRKGFLDGLKHAHAEQLMRNARKTRRGVND